MKDWRLLREKLVAPLDPALEDSVADLNEMPQAVLEQAATLVKRYGRMAGFDYLSYVATDSNWNYLANFLEDVVQKEESAAAWRIDIAFCYLPSESLLDVLRISPSHWARLLGPADDHDIFFYDTAGCHRDDNFNGAPGVVVAPTSYRWKRPAGVEAIVGDAKRVKRSLLPVADISLSLARWMALRIASLSGSQEFASQDELLDGQGVLAAEVSDVAKSAIRGLLREQAEIKAADAPPGFRGPDEWFVSPDETGR